MVDLGKGLHIEVNAEGVETRGQLQFLYESGVDEVQGYLFAPPMPPERFLSWLAGYQGEFGDQSARRDMPPSCIAQTLPHDKSLSLAGAKVLPFLRTRK